MKKLFSMLSSLALVCTLFAPTLAVAAPKSCVTLYEHINFKGRAIRICSNDRTLVNNNWNDLASSAKVSKGQGVVLYQHINYKGHKLKLKAGHKYSDFRNFKLEGQTWNDRVSSVRIR